MKKLLVTAAALVLFSTAPTLAMSCCSSGKAKGAMMCGKGGMAMNHGSRGKKAGCCCDGMSGGNMSKRI